MKTTFFLTTLVASSLLAGCTTTDMQNTLTSMKKMEQSLNEGLAKAIQVPGASGVSPTSDFTNIKQSKLNGVFRQQLSTDGSTPEWPKLVITDLQFPADQLDRTRSKALRPHECVFFNAVLWSDAAHSESFNNLGLCASDLSGQSNSFVAPWWLTPISGKTSGQMRTSGPVPPFRKLPTDADLDGWLTNNFGNYYIGNLLTIVGYDQNYLPDDRRIWLKNIKATPTASRAVKDSSCSLSRTAIPC